jgi:hypothetical protein
VYSELTGESSSSLEHFWPRVDFVTLFFKDLLSMDEPYGNCIHMMWWALQQQVWD